MKKVKKVKKNKRLRIFLLILILILLVVIVCKNYKNKDPKDLSSNNIVHSNNINNNTNDIFVNQNPINETNKVIVQIIQVDNSEDGKETIVEEITKNQGDIINLSQNENYKQYGKKANDIKILEIKNNFVRISRNKTMYKYDEKISEYEYKNLTSYTRTVIEDIRYNEKVEICIDDTSPDSPAFSESRYNYYLRFSF